MSPDKVVVCREVVLVHRYHDLAPFLERPQVAEYSSSVGVIRNQFIERKRFTPFILLWYVKINCFQSLARYLTSQDPRTDRGLAVANHPHLNFIQVAVFLNVVVQSGQNRRMIDGRQNNVTGFAQGFPSLLPQAASYLRIAS